MQKALSALVSGIIGIFKNHKKKIALFALATLFFTFVLFPFGDMGDLVNSVITEQTQGAVNLQFRDMGIDILPQPGFQFHKVAVEVRPLPEIAVESLTVSPSIASLISKKLGASVGLAGLFDGNLSVSFKDQSEDKKTLFDISANWDDIRVDEILRLAKLTKFMGGKFGGEIDGSIDPNMVEQPKISVNIDSNNLELSQIPMVLGGEFYYIPLPKNLRFSKVDLSADLAEKNLQIQKSRLTARDNDLDLQVDGTLDLTLANYGGQITPQIGSYRINLDLKIKQALLSALPLDAVLSSCKTGGEGGTLQYRCRITGRAGSNPQFSKIQ